MYCGKLLLKLRGSMETYAGIGGTHGRLCVTYVLNLMTAMRRLINNHSLSSVLVHFYQHDTSCHADGVHISWATEVLRWSWNFSLLAIAWKCSSLINCTFWRTWVDQLNILFVWKFSRPTPSGCSSGSTHDMRRNGNKKTTRMCHLSINYVLHWSILVCDWK